MENQEEQLDAVRESLKNDNIAIDELLSSIEKSSTNKSKRKNLSERINDWVAEFDQLEPSQIEELEYNMASFVVDHFARIVLKEPRKLNEEEKTEMARGYLSYKVISEALAGYHKTLRINTAMHVIAENTKEQENTETPPEFCNGRVISEKYPEIVFDRFGGKRSNPTIDWELLKEKIGKKNFNNSVCTQEDVPEQHIEAHTRYVPSYDLLLEAIKSGEVDLETLRDCLILGDWKEPRFQVRILAPKEKE